jgi:hypothetical protein
MQHLNQLKAKMEIRWRYVCSREDGRAPMKKKIFVVAAAIAALGMGLHSASASLLGMPLNLKAAIAFQDVDAPVCQFYADDVFPGLLLARGC